MTFLRKGGRWSDAGGVNRGSVLPVATSAFREAKDGRDSPEVQGTGEVWACIVLKRAHADATAGKLGVPAGTPHPDRLVLPLFAVS